MKARYELDNPIYLVWKDTFTYYHFGDMLLVNSILRVIWTPEPDEMLDNQINPFLPDHVVSLAHGVCADTRQVVDALVHIVVNDAFRRRDALALHRQQGRQQGGGGIRNSSSG